MLRVLKAGVGRIVNSATGNNGRNVTIQGTGFVVESPVDGQPYVVTAQHCVNPAYVDTYMTDQGRTTRFTSTGRTIKFLDLPTPVRLTTAFYPPDHVDIALVRVHPEDRHLVAGRALDIMPAEEFTRHPDDGYDYIAGFPLTEAGALIFQSFRRNTPLIVQGRLQGFSGGPLTAMIDGKVKVTSIISQEMIEDRGLNGAVATSFTYENPVAFRRDIQQFFIDAQKNP